MMLTEKAVQNRTNVGYTLAVGDSKTGMLALFGQLFGQSIKRETMMLKLTSTAFSEGGTIPKQYTCDGPNISPELSWNNAPPGTESFSLIVDDPDAPGGTWVHWVLYDLPPDVRELPEGLVQKLLPAGARQGRNDFRKNEYGGPCPPPGPAHRYFFKLYALDRKFNLRPGATKAELERAMQGHVLGHAELIGHYRRRQFF